ncbi:hypothetical protein H1R20_g768, partial [Candolleomyces eurysporus]
MKLTTTITLSALAAFATRVFVWASPDPLRLAQVSQGSDLEIRGEFMDYEPETLWERSFEEELDERSIYDNELELDARDLRNAIEDYLYARAARKAAQHALKGFGDTAAASIAGHANQALNQRKPRTGGGLRPSRSRSKCVLSYKFDLQSTPAQRATT